eukprot:365326-Chlamydomonas_euryale.AAC.1
MAVCRREVLWSMRHRFAQEGGVVVHAASLCAGGTGAWLGRAAAALSLFRFLCCTAHPLPPTITTSRLPLVNAPRALVAERAKQQL